MQNLMLCWYNLVHGGFSVQTFFIMKKSLGGHGKTSVTSLLLKMIKFHAVGKLRRKYWIKLLLVLSPSLSCCNCNFAITEAIFTLNSHFCDYRKYTYFTKIQQCFTYSRKHTTRMWLNVDSFSQLQYRPIALNIGNIKHTILIQHFIHWLLGQWYQ